jgi:hypothetical protein
VAPNRSGFLTPMLFFLRYINPAIAVLVLIICLISACTDRKEGTLEFSGFFRDPIQVYFLGKAIFCSTALFLLGKLLEQVILLVSTLSSSHRENPLDD